MNHLHTFHIPVMGLAYTVDTPVKVARFGIASVISIIEDTLVERMRQYYYNKLGEKYVPITCIEPDYRARRITDYLNLVNDMVNKQVEKLKESSFEAGTELVQYFEMLPENSLLKKMYRGMLDMHDRFEQKTAQAKLRASIRAGSIDVNIMTKLDNDRYTPDGNLIENGSDAVTALRGYANSELTDSSIVFSAGMNPRLFNYMAQLNAFTEMRDGEFVKKIVIKVSDHRSAVIQGKYLAKKGLWVSEFRVESGLNCGGHAFASEGYMLGPILEELKNKRPELSGELFELYSKALIEKGKTPPATPPAIRITVQGGIGTCEEDTLMREYYQMDATGWGSPFLLVPEAVTIDDDTLQLLAASADDDIVLSRNSPMGVPFNYLRGASGEQEKYRAVAEGRPGSSCPEKYLQSNTEFTTKNVCTASAAYIRQKLQQLQTMEMSDSERERRRAAILSKECLCVGLSNTAVLRYKLPPVSKAFSGVTVCPGPNLAYFNKTASLREMIDHIYGRTNLLREGYRPHMFIKEMRIYLSYLNDELSKRRPDDLVVKPEISYRSFSKNMHDAVGYYRSKIGEILTSAQEKTLFLTELTDIEAEINETESSKI
ncbi:MAG: hypothetical protein LBU62_07300 [Bacteroidales bacterium]|jgi:hypothetical protein|nr:hypothetical protein [Bacteroidales bacterium]